jgi:acetyl-CoA carboxylase biotin carboxyl carrier protein
MAHTIHAEMVASVHSVAVTAGESIDAGTTLVVLESMKMEIPVLAESAGTVLEVLVGVGDVVQEGDALVSLSS